MDKTRGSTGSKGAHKGRDSAPTSGRWSARDSTTVAGGHIVREVATGRFIEVTTSKGVSKSSEESVRSVERASSKRGAAMKRLADR